MKNKKSKSVEKGFTPTPQRAHFKNCAKRSARLVWGFTLVEMLVTIFIFSITFGAASGLFVSAIKNQSQTLANQQLLDQTSYIIEYIGRALRMATKDIGGDCISVKSNYATTTSGIRFKNYLDQCQEFFRDCGGGVCRLKENKNGTVFDLTSPNLDILSFNIAGEGWGQGDNLQPRLTIFLEIRKAGAGSQPKIKIQTTISQRRLDILE